MKIVIMLSLGEYNSIIEYASLKGATWYIMEHIPRGFEVFKKEMEDYFVENIDIYLERSRKLYRSKNNRTYMCSLYNILLRCNYDSVVKDIEEKYKELTGKRILPECGNISMKNLKIWCQEEGIDTKKKLKKDLYNEIYAKLYKKIVNI